MNTIFTAFLTDESEIKTPRNMNTVLMFVIIGLVCRFKAPGGGFRNLKFDLINKYIYINTHLKLPTGLGFPLTKESRFLKEQTDP